MMGDNLFEFPLVQHIMKVFFVVGSIFYVIYSFVVHSQIQNMRQTMITPLSAWVQAAGLINLLLSGLLVVIFLLVL